MIIFFRLIHIIIGVFFIFCLGYLFYMAFSDTFSNWAFFYLAAILLEGLILILNKGKCPFTNYQKKIGDNKGFFNLFVPKRMLPFVIPFFILMTALSVVLIYLNHFRK